MAKIDQHLFEVLKPRNPFIAIQDYVQKPVSTAQN